MSSSVVTTTPATRAADRAARTAVIPPSDKPIRTTGPSLASASSATTAGHSAYSHRKVLAGRDRP